MKLAIKDYLLQVDLKYFTQLKDKIDYAVTFAKEVLTADPIEPGEYEIITTPEVSGLIAHEAFGSWCRNGYVCEKPCTW